jgi:hypothetical protein
MAKMIIVCVLFSGLLFAAGCARKETVETNPSQPTPSKPPPTPLVGFDADLQFIKNGQFSYIYVFSRKDGKPLEPTDSEFLRTNAPQMVDWVKTREGKAVIGGTNFNLEEGNMDLLKKRFVVEDYTGR